MTPEERSTLQNIGTALWSNLSSDIPTYFLYGNFYSHRGLSSNNTKATLGVILFSFLGATGVLVSTFPLDVGVIGVFTRDVADTPLEDVVKNMNNVLAGPWAASQTCLLMFP
ncbi:hypothetical protein H0H92_003734, partial [Tricholoma furcatifolium]